MRSVRPADAAMSAYRTRYNDIGWLENSVFPEMAANILAEARRRHDGGERPRTRGLLRPLVDRLPLRRNPLDRRARGAGGAQSRD